MRKSQRIVASDSEESDFDEQMDTNGGSDAEEFVQESDAEEFDDRDPSESENEPEVDEESSSDSDSFVRKHKIPYAKRVEAMVPEREELGLRSRKLVNYCEDTYEELLNAPPVPETQKRRSTRKTTSIVMSDDDDLEDVLAEYQIPEDPAEYEEVEGEEEIVNNEPTVEKILAHRPLESGGNEYYVKWKDQSYLHVSWVTEEEFQKDRFLKSKLLRYHKKHEQLYDEVDEPFNQTYLEVDRIFHHDGEGDDVKYLTKWQQLSYAEATWETPKDVGDDEKIREYHERCKRPPSASLREKARPKPTDWEKYEESPVYKNDHKLRQYQLEGLNWLTFCWYNQRNSILADEMGLGKTVQTVSVVNHLFENVGMRGPFLIVAPLITVPHWQREFEGWTNMNTLVYHGTAEARRMIREYEWYYPRVKPKKGRKKKPLGPPYKFNVLITTYEMVITDVAYLGGIRWKYLAVDEAHRLKNKNCKLINVLRTFYFDHLLLLTGTPLQNNTEELWTLLNLMDPEKFESLDEFSEQFGSLKETAQVEALHAVLRPYLLRRMKEDVEKSIAPKEETIVEVELTTIQKKYYRAIFEKNFSSLNMGSKASNVPSLLNVMMQLRKCCNHPYLLRGVEENIVKSRDNFGDMDENTLLIKSSGKLALIDKLLVKLKAQGHKVLIFSQMVRMLDILEDFLLFRKYAYERIDGSKRGNDRQEAIDRFSAPDSDRFVFLLCTRAGGLGINLTAADTCIIYDSDWNPQNDIQAQARCHRIGQTQMVKIYRLLTHNTYEKKMFEKASLKLGLDQAVLTKMKSGGSSSNNVPLNTKEVDELLKYGAYGAFDDAAGTDQYDEEDIDKILERSATTVVVGGAPKEPVNNALSSFSKASFISSDAETNAHIDVTDPDFWKKLMPDTPVEDPLVQYVPRKRKQVRRYGNVDAMELAALEARSDSDSEMEEYEETNDEPSDDGALGWGVRDRNRLKTHLQTFGYGQWYTIRKAAGLDRRSIAETRAYADALATRFMEFMEEDPEEGLVNLRKNFIPERYAPNAKPAVIPIPEDENEESKNEEEDSQNASTDETTKEEETKEENAETEETPEPDAPTPIETSTVPEDSSTVPKEPETEKADEIMEPADEENNESESKPDSAAQVPNENESKPDGDETMASVVTEDESNDKPDPAQVPNADESKVENDGDETMASVVTEDKSNDNPDPAPVAESNEEGETSVDASEAPGDSQQSEADAATTEVIKETAYNFESDGTLHGYEYKEYAKRNAKLVVRRLESIAKVSKHTIDCIKMFGEEIPIPAIPGEVCDSWTDADDRSLILGTFYHGYGRFAEMRLDPRLTFERFEDPTDVPVNLQNDPRLVVVKTRAQPKEETPSAPATEAKQPSITDATPTSTNEASDAPKEENKTAEEEKAEKEPWPSEKILNRRLRKVLRLIFIEHNHQNALDDARSRKRGDVQEDWTKREKLDFYRVITTHGIRKTNLGAPDWNLFKLNAKLTRKTIPMISEYCAGLMNQANKAKELEKQYDVKRREYVASLSSDSNVEMKEDMSWLACGDISLSSAQCKRVLQRVTLFKNLREKILPMKEELPKLLTEARLSTTLPSWWIPSEHDTALIHGVVKHGFGQWEKICSDPELPFLAIAEERMKSGVATIPSGLGSIPSTPKSPGGHDSDSNKEDDDEEENKETSTSQPKKKKRKRGRQVEVYTNALDFPKEKMLTKRLEYLVRFLTTDTRRTPKRPSRRSVSSPKPEKSQQIRTRPKRVPRSQVKKEPTPSTPVKKKYTEVPRTPSGEVIFPILAGKMRIEKLGEIVTDRPEYHNQNYIWPVGYRAVRTHQSVINPEERTEFISEILDGGEKPIFRVTAADNPEHSASASSATGAWGALLSKGKEGKGKDKKKSNAVSGPEYFGIARAVIRKLIQELPGAEKCHNYQMIEFEEKVQPITKNPRKKQKLNHDTTSDDKDSNEGENDTSDDMDVDMDNAETSKDGKPLKQSKLNFGVTSASGSRVSLLN